MSRNNQTPENSSIETERFSEMHDHELNTPERLAVETSELKAVTEHQKELEEKIEASNLPEKTKKSFLKKLRDLSTKVSMVMSGVLILGASVKYVEYQNALYTVKENRKENGEIVFQHEDPETTRAINILAGIETLSEQEATEIFRESLQAEIKRMSKIKMDDRAANLRINLTEYTEFLKQANTDQLVEFAVTKLGWYPDSGESDDITNYDQIVSWIVGAKDIPPLLKEELYEALWTMEEECGNPKVTIVGSKPENALEFDRSCYDPKTNTIYITPSKSEQAYEHFISELAHSKQHEEKPINMDLQIMLDTFTVYNRMWKTSESYRDAYDNELYDKEGSTEYEAHKIIEPELKKEFESLRPSREIFLAVWQQENDRINLDNSIENHPKEKQRIKSLFSKYEEDFITMSQEFAKNVSKAEGLELKTELVETYKIQCNDLRNAYLKNLGKLIKVTDELIAVG